MIQPSSARRARLRFAPSPNGALHLGHAYAALKTWDLAERWGGEVLLRIEDIDTGRTRAAYIDGIYEDLAWLGLSWPEPVRRQSAHFDAYRAAAQDLRERGFIYPCAATRKQIADVVAARTNWPTDPDGAPLYPGRTMFDAGTSDPVTHGSTPGTTAGASHRLDMVRAIEAATDGEGLTATFCDENGASAAHQIDPSVWGDAVVVRKDTPTSYHLSVVVDDAAQGITHVTRGKDLEAATSIHVLLQRLLGLPTPVYHHHDLITDSSGRKLSKSFHDTSLHHLREEGWTPEDVRKAVGLSPEQK